MVMLYRFGTVIGAIFAYLLGTLILAILVAWANQFDNDEMWVIVPWIAWIFGLIAFVSLFVIYLNKINMWG